MNTKRLPDVIIVTCLVALAAWWWWPAKPVPAMLPVVRVRPAPPTDEPAGPPSEGPELPAVAPVVVAGDQPAAATGTDPQADLSTAIPDFIRLYQSGDYVTLVQNYMTPGAANSEEERATIAQNFQQHAQNPQFMQRMQQEVIKMQLIENLTPTYDDNGNRATYRPPDGSSPVVMVKVTGRWYRQD